MSPRPSQRFPRCVGGSKIGYPSREEARRRARLFARQLNREGKVVDVLYSYRCPTCRNYHLTRENRPGNVVAFVPVDAATQLWAMTPEQRSRALHPSNRMSDRDFETERDLLRLPDPRPEPDERAVSRQPYANRPRGLRYR